jgi:hypothetical protein
MFPHRLDRTTQAALAAAGLLFFLGGAGWALAGDEIFLASIMAGLAGCF